jgi:hypothetical protein
MHLKYKRLITENPLAHRVGLGHSGSFTLRKRLRYNFELITFLVGAAFYNALLRKDGTKNKSDRKTKKKT